MSASEKKHIIKHESRSQPQDGHVGAKEFEHAIEGQRSGNATQASPNKCLWKDCCLSPPMERYLDEPGPLYCKIHQQKDRYKDPENTEAKTCNATETLEDTLESS